MEKSLLISKLILIVVLLLPATINAQWLVGDKALFVWSDNNIGDMSYKLYLAPPNKYQPSIIAHTHNTSYLYPPSWEGTWVVGVIPVNNNTGQEGWVCWSDDPQCVENGRVFKLKVQIKRQGNKPPITRWKIVWR